jgi:hypothetical protein
LLLDFDLDLFPSDLEADLDRPRELLLSDLDREPLPERLFLDRDLLLLPRDLEREREYLERERDLRLPRYLRCGDVGRPYLAICTRSSLPSSIRPSMASRASSASLLS